jgi:hypothetical protein
MYRRIHMAIQNGCIKHIADSINVDMEVVVYVQDSNGNDVECEVEPRGDAVWVTIPLPAESMLPQQQPQPAQIVTGIIDGLLGATATATESLKSLRSRINERE